MKFACPRCGQRIEAGEDWAGQSIDCPNCSKSLVVPSNKSGEPPPGWRGPHPAAKGRVPARAERHKRQPGPGTYFLILLGLAVVAFGSAMLVLRESPGQIFERLTTFLQPPRRPVRSTPEPTPLVLVTPPPLPEYTPKPEPTPEPVAESTPAPPDSLAWLVEHKDQWPAKVELTEETVFPVRVDGSASGSVAAPAGTEVDLVELTADTAGVVYLGGGARVPVEATDVRARSKAAMETAAIAKADAEAAAARAEELAASATPSERKFPEASGSLIAMTVRSGSQNEKTIEKRKVTLDGTSELHVTGLGDVLKGSALNFASPDAWLFFENIRPSNVAERFLDRMWVNGAPAKLDENVRVVAYEDGTVVIPHPPDFGALKVFSGKSLTGESTPLQCYVKYDAGSLGGNVIRSFRLERGYMATLAENKDGTGVSRNYVAQDRAIEIKDLPAGLDGNVRFVRVFPWRWTSKKGVAGAIGDKLNVAWYYDWNIGASSSLDVEYVPIKQKRWWPGLDQDWKAKGSTHLLGFNEPDRPDQANMSVDDAIGGWPELLGTGLRLGSPAVSDGGLGWLYEFIDKADKAGLRVDFVAVHYYRAAAPADARGAASNFRNFLKGIHDRTKRPIWITEWNNGANWTNAGDPTFAQQRRAIQEMVEMLDDAPFVERYAIYNWVEECREVVKGDGSLTPAGEVYRGQKSPVGYEQK